MSVKAEPATLQQPNQPAPSDKSAADERRSGMRTIIRVAPYLWPKDRMDIRLRVVGSLLFLILSKFLSIYSPFLYGAAVDALSEGGMPLFALGAVGLIVAYGGARIVLRDRKSVV